MTYFLGIVYLASVAAIYLLLRVRWRDRAEWPFRLGAGLWVIVLIGLLSSLCRSADWWKEPPGHPHLAFGFALATLTCLLAAVTIVVLVRSALAAALAFAAASISILFLSLPAGVFTAVSVAPITYFLTLLAGYRFNGRVAETGVSSAQTRALTEPLLVTIAFVAFAFAGLLAVQRSLMTPSISGSDPLPLIRQSIQAPSHLQLAHALISAGIVVFSLGGVGFLARRSRHARCLAVGVMFYGTLLTSTGFAVIHGDRIVWLISVFALPSTGICGWMTARDFIRFRRGGFQAFWWSDSLRCAYVRWRSPELLEETDE